MSDQAKVEMGAVQIPREHQSAPKEHWADREIIEAAREIDEGQFQPDRDDDVLDAFGVGLRRGQNIPADPRSIDPMGLADTAALIQHPRVKEALARLEQEKRDARNTQELLEKTQMLHELNAAAAGKEKWAGQGRWMGKEAEEQRIGQIMSPQSFLQKLSRVIGDRRVFLNRFAVNKRVALLAPPPKERPASLILLPNQAPDEYDGMVQIGTLQYPCGTEWMVMRFDDFGVPTTAKYLGWRTALLSMIQLGVITEKEAHQAFPLAQSAASAWYEEQLFIMRAETGAVN